MGAKMKKMIRKLALITGAALLAFAFAACPNDNGIEPTDLPSLREAWAPYFPLGNIIANRYRNDLGHSRRLQLLTHHFDLLTAENEMKPNVLRTGSAYPGGWNWAQAEALLNFAESNNVRFHGHTLAWHSQSHQWLAQGVSPTVAEARLRNHIETVMTRFGNRVESWDVLNEVILSGGPGASDSDIFGNTLGAGVGFPHTTTDADLPFNDPNWDWRKSLRTPANVPNETNWPAAINVPTNNASCFVEIAFLEARRVADANDFDIVMYYNDYNLNIPRKRLGVYRMVKDINERHRDALGGRNLIEAIGMQAHYWLPGTVGNQNRTPPVAVCVFDVRDSFVRFASLGVYVSITELDIFAGPREMDQAVMYARLFNLFRSFSQARRFPADAERGLDERSVLRRVSIWGVDDPSSWRNTYNPLLFNAGLNPKQAFWAVLDPNDFLGRYAPQYLGEFDNDCFDCPTWESACFRNAGN